MEKLMLPCGVRLLVNGSFFDLKISRSLPSHSVQMAMCQLLRISTLTERLMRRSFVPRVRHGSSADHQMAEPLSKRLVQAPMLRFQQIMTETDVQTSRSIEPARSEERR